MKPSFNMVKQKGFSLIELLVAGLLGLVLLGGVVQLFLGSSENYRMQDELASMQEDGRFALMFLNDQIEMAGWTADDAYVVPAIDLLNSADGANDSIAVSYVRAINGTDNRDCNGVVVADGRVTNQFSVNANNELVCQGIGGGGAAQPMIGGVESFQVLYGVETELVCPDGAVDRYMTRNELNASGLGSNVISVRVSLLLNSQEDILKEDLADQFQVADQLVNFNDRRVRRLFQETIFMPNSAYNVLTSTEASVKCMSGF